MKGTAESDLDRNRPSALLASSPATFVSELHRFQLDEVARFLRVSLRNSFVGQGLSGFRRGHANTHRFVEDAAGHGTFLRPEGGLEDGGAGEEG